MGKGVTKMEIKIPKTKDQIDFESNVQYLINVMSELPKEEQKQLIDYAVFLANN